MQETDSCIAAAIGKSVCVWKLRDKSSCMVSLPNVITTLKWRVNEQETEPPLLLVSVNVWANMLGVYM